MPSDAENLAGRDLSWIASDRLDQVGLFVTAGSGPVPPSAFSWVEEAEEQACALPTICVAELLMSLPRPDDFLELGRRGFFAFDWTDAGKEIVQATNTYELVCRPAAPVVLGTLPLWLQSAARATRIDTIFGHSSIRLRA